MNLNDLSVIEVLPGAAVIISCPARVREVMAPFKVTPHDGVIQIYVDPGCTTGHTPGKTRRPGDVMDVTAQHANGNLLVYDYPAMWVRIQEVVLAPGG